MSNYWKLIVGGLGMAIAGLFVGMFDEWWIEGPVMFFAGFFYSSLCGRIVGYE